MYYDTYSQYIYNYLKDSIYPLLQTINNTLSSISSSLSSVIDYLKDNSTILLFIFFTILLFAFVRKRWFIND